MERTHRLDDIHLDFQGQFAGAFNLFVGVAVEHVEEDDAASAVDLRDEGAGDQPRGLRNDRDQQVGPGVQVDSDDAAGIGFAVRPSVDDFLGRG